MKKQLSNKKEKKPAWKLAQQRLLAGPLGDLMDWSYVHCNEDYPMAKGDWAYATSDGDVFLNPRRQADVSEWQYVISHCLLHLGMGHMDKLRMEDRAWIMACDLVVTRFLRDSRIGTPPPEFQAEFPIPVKDEEQTYERLLLEPELLKKSEMFSTMSLGRPDMVWTYKSHCDYTEIFADSLQNAIRRALGSFRDTNESDSIPNTPYHRAREWFISSYPLLGALAASFRIVDDRNAVYRIQR